MNGSSGLNDDPALPATRWLGRCLSAALLIVCVLAAWTILVCQFVPSRLGAQISAMAAISFGGVYAMWTYVDPAYARNTPERTARLARAPFLGDPLSRTVVLGLFASFVTFEAVSGAGLELWTRVTGRPAVAVLHLGAYHVAYRGSCAGFDVKEAPFKLHRFVCADFPPDAAPLPGTRLNVLGPASPVGIDVRRFRIGR